MIENHSSGSSSADELLPASPRGEFGALVGNAEPMRRAFALLERTACCDATVLIEGETGTGKEVAASSIHQASSRRLRPFVVVDCGAIAAPLLESELFGHEKGAFTGAVNTRVGAFEAASGGTIFLDEIGELPLDLQPKFLRVLEQRKVRRVGANDYRPITVRVVAATNRDLLAEVRRGRFRQDLYYRLAVLRVRLPPLRERAEDFPLLVTRILETLGFHPQAGPDFTCPQFLATLQRATWPGNVRELRNYLERCVALGSRLPLNQDSREWSPARSLAAHGSAEPFLEARKRAADAWEREYLQELMRQHGQCVEQAARAAAIGRSYLYRLLSRHEILAARRSPAGPSDGGLFLSSSLA